MAVGPRQLKPSMLILLCVSSASWADPGDDMLPPPPVPQSVNDEAVFQLALIVNHYDTGLVVPVTRRQAEYLTLNTAAARPPCGMSFAILTTGDRYPPPVT